MQLRSGSSAAETGFQATIRLKKYGKAHIRGHLLNAWLQQHKLHNTPGSHASTSVNRTERIKAQDCSVTKSPKAKAQVS